jgi:pimeloyl-ACP methyl ester carboxylesterase
VVAGRPWRIDPETLSEAIEAYATGEGFAATLEHAITGRAERLDEVRAPVTIVWGTRDVVLLPRQGRRYARAIPGAELRLLPGCGHIPMWDDPALVAETILELTSPRPPARAPA